VSRTSPNHAALLEDLLRAGRQLSAATIMFHQAVADRLGLNATDHKCMDLLFLKGPMTAGELADLTGLTTGAITAVIDRLEDGRFVRREDDPGDRRRVIVRVVARRHREIGRLFEHLAAMTTALGSRYDEGQLGTILDFMTRSQQALHQATVKLREEGESAGRGRKSSARTSRRKGG
jgi:DNA-binding MarR family transcriptional regulator